ncbi:DMT family transporter [Selenomonadales bacterium OttesenSCG-928-I06]|nr:DMT family transporter [Selenomonadales bacterium OttesenSCG-928-I06]
MSNTNNLKIYLILLLVPLFWGGAFSTTKHIVEYLSPLSTSFIRFFLAALLMMAWITIKKEWDFPSIKKNWLLLISCALTGIFSYNFFFAAGLKHISAINAALVMVAAPPVTAFIASVFLKEKYNIQTIIGIFLSLIGITTVITKGNLFSFLAADTIGIGEIYMLISMLSWATYTTLVKQLITKNVNSDFITTFSTFMGSIFLLIGSFITDGNWFKPQTFESLPTQVYIELFYLIVFPTFIAFIIYSWGIKIIGSIKASSYMNLTPINALWIAALFYGEIISAYQIIGMLITITGVIITNRSKVNLLETSKKTYSN